MAALTQFLAWLLGKDSQREMDGGSGRTFRDRVAWCWNVVPVVKATGVVHDEVQLDGLYLSGGWCVLIAYAEGNVIDWQWCDRENKPAWIALLERVPAPRVAVVDGGSGLGSAIKETWPDTRVQRCLVHVKRSVLALTSRKPRTEACRTLKALAEQLTRVKTLAEAVTWAENLHAWHQLYGDFINEITVAGAGVIRPEWAPANRDQWWTHKKLRDAYYRLATRVKAGDLFTFLDPAFEDLSISRTTNRIEGGVNAQLRLVLRHHRGLPIERRRRAIEWWCHKHAEFPVPIRDLIQPEHWQPTPPRHVADDTTPGDWGTAATAEEGLVARQGWGGRPARGYTTKRAISIDGAD
jgi:hypothetical protein